MNGTPIPLAGRAAALRQAFDRSFAQPPAPEAARTEDYLAIRVAGNPYALRVAEIAGLFADKAVTPVPSVLPELLGVFGLRGAIVPVYGLGALLGHGGATQQRWLALLQGGVAVGVAFERFDGQIRFEPGSLKQAKHTNFAVRGVVRFAERDLPVVHLPSILTAIEKRVLQDTR